MKKGADSFSVTRENGQRLFSCSLVIAAEIRSSNIREDRSIHRSVLPDVLMLSEKDLLQKRSRSSDLTELFAESPRYNHRSGLAGQFLQSRSFSRNVRFEDFPGHIQGGWRRNPPF